MLYGFLYSVVVVWKFFFFVFACRLRGSVFDIMFRPFLGTPGRCAGLEPVG